MFTVTDAVDNTSAAPVTLAPYVSIQRQDLPAGLGKSNIVHEGAVGILDPEKSVLRLASYKQWKKKGEIDWPSRGGWLGVTDKYWMTAFIPDQHERIDAKVRLIADQASHVDVYEATYSGAPARHRAGRAGGRGQPPVRRRQGRAGAQRLQEIPRRAAFRRRHRLGPPVLHHQADLHPAGVLLPDTSATSASPS